VATAPIVTAAAVIIGNEILSGRTADANLTFLGRRLNEEGVRLREVRVVADDEEAIVEAVNALRARFDYVFTTGGIGPTHDDITAAAVAAAFGLPLILNEEAVARMREHYSAGQLNEARLRMARTPEGATLIDNPVSKAPGFRVENVYVFAGVPRIMQAMFENVAGELAGGTPTLARTVSVFVTEGEIAEGLSALQERHNDLEIGSYPFVRDQKLGTSLVIRGTDAGQIDVAADALLGLINELGGKVIEDSGAAR
jgi:molybdenum cofactor synthesis domain-containing protein